jgi:hypothetical protein
MCYPSQGGTATALTGNKKEVIYMMFAYDGIKWTKTSYRKIYRFFKLNSFEDYSGDFATWLYDMKRYDLIRY